MIHVWSRCGACGVKPIEGLRFRCGTCPSGPDNDLCESCYRQFERDVLLHPTPGGRGAHLTSSVHRFRLYEGLPRQKYLPWLQVPAAGDRAPAIPDGFVIRPEFRSGWESYVGSYGFITRSDGGGLLMVTALHIMDELIRARGLDCTPANCDYTGRELPSLITAVTLYDVFAKRWMFAELSTASKMLALAGARIGVDEPDSSRDIAAFRVDSASLLHPVTLASRAPLAGEPVWLVANNRSGQRTFEAVTVQTTVGAIIFRFIEDAALPPYTSGAPLLNREGSVAGINSGAGYFEGQRFGHANHVDSIRRHLSGVS